MYVLFPYRNIKFHNNTGTKRVASEEIIEVDDLSAKKANNSVFSVSSTINAKQNASSSSATTSSILSHKFLKPQISIGSLSNNKNSLKNLVKRKTATKIETNTAAHTSETATISTTPDDQPQTTSIQNESKTVAPKSNALSLLCGYDDEDDSNSEGSD